MGLRLGYRDLEGHERRAALMRLAGSSTNDIALLLETSVAEISHILSRPNVAKYMLHISSTYVDDAKDVVEMVKDVNEKIAGAAEEALETELEIMRDLRSRKDNVRALIAAASTAQDILDRAGNRAPTRSITGIVHAIAPASLDKLAEVLNEMGGEGRGAIEVEALENGKNGGAVAALSNAG